MSPVDPSPSNGNRTGGRGGPAVIAIVATIAIMTCGGLGIALGAILEDFRKGFWISAAFSLPFACALGWFAMRDRRGEG